MEFWNSKNMVAPPTYTYEIYNDVIDLNHLRTVLQDGTSFYKEQNQLKMEIALLSRIIYRMKTKFRNSKDFHNFEKVKKTVLIFEEMRISQKIEYLLSILPSYDYQQITISVPTKNMVDYILVQLQGVGKILCKAIETCKLTVMIYERRLYLGHFWQLALIAIALVSRIHLVCLNIIKYTCTLYSRLLPFSHKLRNVTRDWLPKEYIFPKDLKNWLGVEWTILEEIIEVPDDEFNMSFIDLAGDSDDEVEFVEISDMNEILEDFKRIQNEKNSLEQSLIIVPSTPQKKMQPSKEKNIQNEDIVEEMDESQDALEIDTKSHDDIVEEGVRPEFEQKADNIDIGEVILSDDEMVESKSKLNSELVDTKKIRKRKSDALIISSDEEGSVQLIAEIPKAKKLFTTTDFIPIGACTPSSKIKKRRSNKKKNKKKTRN